MALIRWRPLSYRMPTVFEELLGHPFGDWPFRALRTEWRPTSDVVDRKNEMVVRMELAGVDKDDVHISLADNVLTIRGEKKREEAQEDEQSCWEERAWGSFERSFYLPAEIDADKINAAYKHGVLEVHLPKTKTAQPKEVKIETE